MPKTVGPISAGNWAKLADEVMRTFERTRDHDYPSRAEFVAERDQLHPQTIRRIVSARAFLYELEVKDHILASLLLTQPYTAIEPIAKWYRYDREIAVTEARALVDGRHTVRSLTAAEKAAREKANLFPGPREWVAAVIEHILRSAPGYRRVPLDSWRTSSIDAILEPTDGEGHHVMILAVGPYSDRDLYMRKRLDTLLIAAGLVSLGRQVVIALPAGVSTKPFTLWIQEHSIAGATVASIDFSAPLMVE